MKIAWRGARPVGITLVTTCIVGATYLLCAQSAEPFDDRDLLPDFSNPRGNDNPLAACQRWLAANPFVGDIPSVSIASEAREFEQEELADFESFLRANARHLAKVDELLATNADGWGWLSAEKMISAGEFETHNIGDICQFPVIFRMQSLLSEREHRFNDAAAWSLKQIKLGRGFSDTKSNLIHLLLGLHLARKGEERLHLAAASMEPTGAQLADWQTELAGDEATLRSLSFAIRAAYGFSKSLFDHLIASTPGAEGKVVGAELREKSLRELSVAFRALLVSHASWPQLRLTLADLEKQAERIEEPSEVTLTEIGKLTGKTMTSMFSFGFNSGCRKVYAFSALRRITTCQLAIRRYEIANGELPKDLSALVPTYLPRPLGDPFAAGNLRWEPMSQVIYSVGPNEIDDHGAVDLEDPLKGADIGEPYWWKSKPPPRG